jgi:hypothetical protein
LHEKEKRKNVKIKKKRKKKKKRFLLSLLLVYKYSSSLPIRLNTMSQIGMNFSVESTRLTPLGAPKVTIRKRLSSQNQEIDEQSNSRASSDESTRTILPFTNYVTAKDPNTLGKRML